MRPLRSLGYRTDLTCLGEATEVLERDDHCVVRSPRDPLYFWGNLLLFDAPPSEADVERWPRLFREAFAGHPEVGHTTLGWDAPNGELGAAEAFFGFGFELDVSHVLVADRLQAPPKVCADVEVRSLSGDADWRAAMEVQMSCRPDIFEVASYRRFKQARMDAYRALAEAGRGDWFGAFLDGRMVADLGVFHEDGLARYQMVGTHPDFRRQGICGSLVHAAGQRALARRDVERLVMCAEADGVAEGIYRSVGFEPVERQVGLCRWGETESAHRDAASRSGTAGDGTSGVGSPP